MDEWTREKNQMKREEQDTSKLLFITYFTYV